MDRRSGQISPGLEERSHLFLSSSSVRRGKAAGEDPAVIYICAAEPAFIRAIAAAGTARALESNGMDVELIEAGAGLPNSGYYLGLPAREYLAGSIEPGTVVEGKAAPALRYRYFDAVPGRFPPARGGPVPGRPSVTVFAYGHPDSFDSLPPSPPGSPAALLVFDLAGGSPFAGREIDSFGSSHPGMPVFFVSGNGRGPEDDGPRTRTLPAAVIAGLADRAVPSDPFFYGLASGVLQGIVSAVSG